MRRDGENAPSLEPLKVPPGEKSGSRGKKWLQEIVDDLDLSFLEEIVRHVVLFFCYLPNSSTISLISSFVHGILLWYWENSDWSKIDYLHLTVELVRARPDILNHQRWVRSDASTPNYTIPNVIDRTTVSITSI